MSRGGEAGIFEAGSTALAALASPSASNATGRHNAALVSVIHLIRSRLLKLSFDFIISRHYCSQGSLGEDSKNSGVQRVVSVN